MPTLRSRLCKTSWVCSELMYSASAIDVTDCGLWRKSLIRCRSSSVNAHTSWGSPIALSRVRGDGALWGSIATGDDRLAQKVCQGDRDGPEGGNPRVRQGRRVLGAHTQDDIRGGRPWTRGAECTDHGAICRCIRRPCHATPVLAGVRLATSAWAPQGTTEGSHVDGGCGRGCRMLFSRGPIKRPHARVRWGETGDGYPMGYTFRWCTRQSVLGRRSRHP